MKKFFLFLILIFTIGSASAQKVITTTKKFDIGIYIFNDIWMDKPDNMKIRFFNQGAGVHGMYNHKLGESNVSLAIGVGLWFHNLFSDNIILDQKADSISFMKIPDEIDYKKSKINVNYIEVPFEIRFRSPKGFRIAAGFRAGYLYDSKTKYKGNRYSFDDQGNMVTLDGKMIKVKSKTLEQLERFRYGPTFRIGYKWFNVFGYMALSNLFIKDKGPELYPISVGIALIPYY